MGLLDSFERGLERAVNGAFAKTFRSGIQPVEIAAALRSAMDTDAAVVSRERILVPHAFRVSLAPSDYERMTKLGDQLISELTALLTSHARAQRYSLSGSLRIALHADPKLSAGQLQVEPETTNTDVSWRGEIEIAGKRYPLTAARTVIGRGSDADITLSDAGTSRKHVEILWDGTRAMARDLGSTNGTRVNGEKVREAALSPGATVTIGRTDIVFRVVPHSAAPDPNRSGRSHTAWRDPLA